MIDRILVAVDGSEGQSVAMAHGLALAEATGASVDVISVLDRDLTTLFSMTDDEVRRERGREILADATAQATAAGVPVETHLTAGTPSREILALADDRDADLLVLGRHGPQGLRERLLGSVTTSVLRDSSRPVLTTGYEDVTDAQAVTVERLLVPTDGSEPAEAAAPVAGTLAAQFGATVDVVSVVDVATEAGPFDAGGVSEAFVERLERTARTATDRIAERLHDTDPDVAVTTTVARGRPHVELRAAIEGGDIDLVVMGSHGRSGVTAAALGSVTNRVLQLVDVPVLVVPPAE